MQKQIDDADARVNEGTLSKEHRQWGMFPEYIEGLEERRSCRDQEDS